MLQGKKILIGITGSIAAYKSPLLIRLLIKAGAEVKVIMTPSASQFVSPLVLATLSRNRVFSSLSEEDQWANHVELGRWADVMLVAPLSCNTLSKMAQGQCDNLLLAVYLSATCPVILSPAMDEDMYHHPSTKQNIQLIRSRGQQVIEAAYGELASGLTGMGRMPEPENLYQLLEDFFSQQGKFQGLKALITAGPTYENIDPVRFIGNYSSGKMGVLIAEELLKRGCEVSLILGPSALQPRHPRLELVRVTSAADMFEACISRFETMNIAVMSAAVADFTPENPATHKIKKSSENLSISLVKTRDILATLGQQKKEDQVLMGFALESRHEREYALRKLTEKRADAIVMNSLQDVGAGFAHDTNKVTIFEKDGREEVYALKSKSAVAVDIADTLYRLCQQKGKIPIA